MRLAMDRRLPLCVLLGLGCIGLGCATAEDDGGWSGFGNSQTTFDSDNGDGDEETGDESGDSGDSTDAEDDESSSDESSSSDDTSDSESESDSSSTDEDTTTTTDTGDDCGNAVVDPGEGCDGLNFNGQTCIGLGFDAGQLACTADCELDTSGCTNNGGGGQPADGLYSMCLVPGDCAGTDGCATVTMNGQPDPYDGYCTNFCASDAECDAGLGGTATPDCNTAVDPYCELNCDGGKTCPQGMTCTAITGPPPHSVCY